MSATFCPPSRHGVLALVVAFASLAACGGTTSDPTADADPPAAAAASAPAAAAGPASSAPAASGSPAASSSAPAASSITAGGTSAGAYDGLTRAQFLALLSPNATVFDVTAATPRRTINLAANEDAIIRIGTASDGFVELSGLKITGGRNVFISGGHLRRIANTPTNNLTTGERDYGVAVAMLAMFDQTGTVWVEGLLVDNANVFGVDAIAIGNNALAKVADYYFRDVRVENVYGYKAKIGGKELAHADALQIQRPIRSLHITGMTVGSAYQGLQLEPKDFTADLIQLRRVNTRYPDPARDHGYANGYAFWLGDGDSLAELQACSYRFEDVYVEPRTDELGNEWGSNSAAPQVGTVTTDGLTRTGAVYTDASHTAVTWPSITTPNIRYDGIVRKGLPPEGDYVPRSRIVDASGRVVYRPQ